MDLYIITPVMGISYNSKFLISLIFFFPKYLSILNFRKLLYNSLKQKNSKE